MVTPPGPQAKFWVHLCYKIKDYFPGWQENFSSGTFFDRLRGIQQYIHVILREEGNILQG